MMCNNVDEFEFPLIQEGIVENLFDVINNRMFSVFASKDRRANYDLLSTIYDI